MAPMIRRVRDRVAAAPASGSPRRKRQPQRRNASAPDRPLPHRRLRRTATRSDAPPRQPGHRPHRKHGQAMGGMNLEDHAGGGGGMAMAAMGGLCCPWGDDRQSRSTRAGHGLDIPFPRHREVASADARLVEAGRAQQRRFVVGHARWSDDCPLQRARRVDVRRARARRGRRRSRRRSRVFWPSPPIILKRACAARRRRTRAAAPRRSSRRAPRRWPC